MSSCCHICPVLLLSLCPSMCPSLCLSLCPSICSLVSFFSLKFLLGFPKLKELEESSFLFVLEVFFFCPPIVAPLFVLSTIVSVCPSDCRFLSYCISSCQYIAISYDGRYTKFLFLHENPGLDIFLCFVCLTIWLFLGLFINYVPQF